MARKPPPEPRRARAGIHDVAAAAGVSVVTVSRAFNTPDKVSAKTRQRIDEAIRKIGYVPDLVARSLVSRKSRVIAACVPTFVLSAIPDCDSIEFHLLHQALFEHLWAAGYTVADGHMSIPETAGLGIEALRQPAPPIAA